MDLFTDDLLGLSCVDCCPPFEVGGSEQLCNIKVAKQGSYGSWNSRILFSRPGKSLNLMVGHGKLS